jgi:hypothetical protein
MTVMMMPFCEAQAPTRHKRQAGTSTRYSKYGVSEQKFKKGSVRALFVSLVNPLSEMVFDRLIKILQILIK